MVDGGQENASRGRQGRRVSYPKRISLDLIEDDCHALQGARDTDRGPLADRIRALLSLCQQDSALAAAVSIRAQEQLLASMSLPEQVEPTAGADPPYLHVTADPGVPPAS